MAARLFLVTRADHQRVKAAKNYYPAADETEVECLSGKGFYHRLSRSTKASFHLPSLQEVLLWGEAHLASSNLFSCWPHLNQKLCWEICSPTFAVQGLSLVVPVVCLGLA